MLADYHLHSEFSDDTIYPVATICQDAVRLNLDEICFTDHVDYGVKPDHDHIELARIKQSGQKKGQPIVNVDYDRYFPAIAEARERLSGDLTVKCGLEFGVQTHTIPQFNRLFEAHAHELDFTILSIHQVGDVEFWSGAFQEGRTQQKYYDAYYEEVLRVAERFDHYCVIGHLDHIKRYERIPHLPFANCRDIVAAILERVIANGKGIEVNTSSFRFGLDDLTPSTEILELYRDLGGRVVTIGSDSHRPEHLGSYINVARKRLAALGFTELCTFDHMEPRFHPLME